MLQRFVSVACCLLLTIQMTEVSAAAQQSSTASAPVQDSVAVCKQPCLEDGTPIKLRIGQTVSSADAHLNDRVEFEVLEEVRISGVLIIPKGGIAPDDLEGTDSDSVGLSLCIFRDFTYA